MPRQIAAIYKRQTPFEAQAAQFPPARGDDVDDDDDDMDDDDEERDDGRDDDGDKGDQGTPGQPSGADAWIDKIPKVLRDPALAKRLRTEDVADELPLLELASRGIERRPIKVTHVLNLIKELLDLDYWLAIKSEMKLWLKVNFEAGASRGLVFWSLLQSLETSLKQRFLISLNPLSEKTSAQVIGFLDSQYNASSEDDTSHAKNELKRFKRGDSETLTNALSRYSGIINRAVSFWIRARRRLRAVDVERNACWDHTTRRTRG